MHLHFLDALVIQRVPRRKIFTIKLFVSISNLVKISCFEFTDFLMSIMISCASIQRKYLILRGPSRQLYVQS